MNHHCRLPSEGERCGWLPARSGDAVIAETNWDLSRLLLGEDATRNNSVSSVAQQRLCAVSVVVVHK